MKRLLAVMSMMALTLPGCVNPHVIGAKQAEQSTAATSTANQRPPTVYPDQIDESNAHDKALALSAEMDYDAQRLEARSPALPK